MITKNELKYYASLQQKKYRKLENKFLVEGKKILPEALNSSYKCEVVFATNHFIEANPEYIEEIKSKGAKLIALIAVEFQRISDLRTPEGIAGIFLMKQPVKLNLNSFTDSLLVYLDDISDPGNVGTIIRNCDWFGINYLFLSSETAELFNPKVIRASMGSVFHLNVFENIDLKKLNPLKQKGYKFLCADIEGESIFEFKATEKNLLILSNETSGPSDEVNEFSDVKITIPGKGKAESLNVASASAVLLAILSNQLK